MQVAFPGLRLEAAWQAATLKYILPSHFPWVLMPDLVSSGLWLQAARPTAILDIIRSAENFRFPSQQCPPQIDAGNGETPHQ
eukprot:1153418-Pelagomonas_calceolata.AAC.4